MSNSIKHRPVHSQNLPKPAGPYSPGVILDRLIFVAGQGAADPATGKLAGQDIESQTEQVLKNIATILEAAGPSPGRGRRGGVFLVETTDCTKISTRKTPHRSTWPRLEPA